MKIKISVIQVAVETKPTAKGSYQMATITYKDLGNGKVNEKKVMSFTNKEVFSAVSGAKSGDVLDVTMEKGEKYWEWIQVGMSAPGSAVPAESTGTLANKYTGGKSTYETPEERALRQVYIVKQSCLSTAAGLLSLGAKSPPTAEAVIELADKFKDYVFAKPSVPTVSLADMENDLPE